ncbi:MULTISPECIES: organic hydroperoxide resistance protein [Halobacillus]|uniref:Organic hydroperoxide resistance protein n=1 Tax=Halobacillus halophilus (strain ATCC 35676 / DSM 2266 / JCM 20832 / KCTC 3685 / LMG 17431 / NBRC 102448 / NCIMB 2269) TaxID=866895 RepID=I0JHU9_HALH3|nr:organic hydroperoxide resistance protein [Halobacillus halophilus]ASF37920.1 Organic hydroperoxide resistance protein OhrA [Halobacillus halophilus]CCG43717.1 organic hydroperoxide resistance protein [Halobacillus halophilus DSM 2266]
MSNVMFTAHATAQGGRNGHVKSDDGLIDLNLVMPGEGDEKGSNPEQLFAAGYSACYDGALNLVASKKKKDIESEITADVSLLKDESDNGFKVGVVLNVQVKGVSQEEAEELAEEAHKVCPYSKATSGNINVEINTKAV